MTQVSVCQSQSRLHSVNPPFLQGGGGALSQPNLKKGGSLTGPQLLEEVAGKEGGDFFQGWGAIVT